MPTCPCSLCEGKNVSQRTFDRHNGANKTRAAVNIPTFAEWKAAGTSKSGGKSGKEKEEENSEGEEGNSDAEEDENKMRYMKRRRTNTSTVMEIDRTFSNEITLETISPRSSPSAQELSEHDSEVGGLSDTENPGPEKDSDDDDIVRAVEVNAMAEQARAMAALAQTFPDDDNDLDDLFLQGDGDIDNVSNNSQEAPAESRIDDIRIIQQFTREIQSATLDNGKLDQCTIERLRKPLEEAVDISDPDTRLSLDLYLAMAGASEETYKATREAVVRRFPDTEILSWKAAKNLITEITGVVSIEDDMCINSCHAFTGPWEDLAYCFICGESRYEETLLPTKQVPRQKFTTFPLGPQLQALRRSPECASSRKYRHRRTEELLGKLANGEDNFDLDDIMCGSEYLKLAQSLPINEHDSLIMMSLDGAQLYQNKQSDTWIAVWTNFDFAPTVRYKKKAILPSFTIPGPNKPRHMESFTYRALHHLSALQREDNGNGFKVWDATDKKVASSRPILAAIGADSVALVTVDGKTGHHSAHGCRVPCKMRNRHKSGVGHYHMVHNLPNNYHVAGCTHPDIDIRSMATDTVTPEEYRAKVNLIIGSANQDEYIKNRLETGISKPSLLDGLRPDCMFPLPGCFSLDVMHLVFLNLGSLLLPLWRGTIRCDPGDDKANWPWVTLTGDNWKHHGEEVAAATKYFPSFFYRPPRNPAEKLNSGFKASEWWNYLFGMGPNYFRPYLPKQYWENFCRLAVGAREVLKRKQKRASMPSTHASLIQFVEDFETLYYQRFIERMHFCCPCIHYCIHAVPETYRMGPLGLISQFTMERTIGNLGEEVRQPSNPFRNLSERCKRRACVNALLAMCPELDYTVSTHARYSVDTGHGYILLHPRDKGSISLTTQYPEAAFLFDDLLGYRKIRRYGRLQLPNGQIARSLWSETRQANSSHTTRITRNVLINWNDRPRVAEVQFFFMYWTAEEERNPDATGAPYALVSLYSECNEQLLRESHGACWTGKYTGNNGLKIVEGSKIQSVLSMHPLLHVPGDPPEYEGLWCISPRSGLDDIDITGFFEAANHGGHEIDGDLGHL